MTGCCESSFIICLQQRPEYLTFKADVVLILQDMKRSERNIYNRLTNFSGSPDLLERLVVITYRQLRWSERRLFSKYEAQDEGRDDYYISQIIPS